MKKHPSTSPLCRAILAVLFPLSTLAAPPEEVLKRPVAGGLTPAALLAEAGVETGEILSTRGGARLRARFQKLEAHVEAQGLRLDSLEEGGGGLALKAAALGRTTGVLEKLALSGQVAQVAERAVFSRPGLVEEFSVSLEGVRQDFIVQSRPAGEGELVVELGLRGAHARQTAQGAVILALAGSGRELAYHRLHVEDAAGRVLEARLEVAGAHELRVVVEDAGAAYPVRIDPTFSDLDWTSLNPALAGADDIVTAAVVDDLGRLYVGGYFTFIGDTAASRVARWDGSTWTALGAGLNTHVNALAVHGTDVYVGGDFSEAGGSPAARIARWDGAAWHALGSGLAGGNVRALAVVGGVLYAGGSFTTAGGAPAAHIARWNGAAWSALGSGTGSEVLALHAAGTDLYVGGGFTEAGGAPAARIARWDGAAWHAVGGGMGDGTVRALVASGGVLYAAGSFTEAGGTPAARVAAWDGSAWSALGGGIAQQVRCLTVMGGQVFAGGDFTGLGGGAGAAAHIARWDGSQWQAVGGGMNAGGAVNTLVVAGGDLYAGGQFTTAGGLPAARLARWTGSAWNSTGAAGINGSVRALALHAGEIYAGGSFTTAGGAVASRIARWDGAAWHPLGAGLDGDVHALLSLGGDLYAGGAFATAGGVPALRVARWDGAAWHALGSGLNGTVHALAAHGGAVHAAGVFTGSGGTTLNRVARWSGSAWTALGNGMNESVLALASSGARLYAGGTFTTAGDGAAARVAVWESGAWSALGTGVNSTVRALAASTAEVFVGGDFNVAGEASAQFIARWSGGAWHPLGAGMNNQVHSLAITGAGLHAGGHFTTAGGASASSIAKWTGSAWLPLGSGASGLVRALVVANAELYVGGDFITVGAGLASPFVAKATLPAGLPAIRVEQPVDSALSPGISSVNHGSTPVGGPGTVRVFTVRNPGSAALDLTSVALLPGPAAADFTPDLTGTSLTLAPGAVTTFSITFTPVTSGVRTAVLRVQSHDPLLPNFDITLTGTGQAVGVPHIIVRGNGQVIPAGDLLPESADHTDFGALPVLDAQARRVFTVSNAGGAPLTLLGSPRVTLGGMHAADFELLSSPAGSVAEAGSITFEVQFDPRLPGWRSATLSLSSDDPSTPVYTFAIGGYGSLPKPLVQSVLIHPPGTLYAGQGSVQLYAHATSGLPVTFSLLSGPASLSGSVLTPTGPGTVRVQASQAGGGAYAPARSVVLSISIRPAPSTPALVNLVHRYDGTPKAAAVVGATGGAVITYQLASTPITPVQAGRYKVRAEVDGRVLQSVLVIEKAPLWITAHDQRRFIGEANPTLTWEYEGFHSSDDPSTALSSTPQIKTTATARSTGGAYPITLSGGVSANYRLIHRPGTLVVESVSGSYEALLADTGGQTAGKLVILAAKSGARFTGSLLTAAEKGPVPLKGELFLDASTGIATGMATTSVGGTAYHVTCQLLLQGRMTATVTQDGAAHATADAGVKLPVFPAGTRLPHSGPCTAILEPATPAASTVPAGAGWAAGSISPTGVLTLTGRLADGTAFTTALAPDRRESPGHRLFIQPYKAARARAFLGGQFQLTPHPVLPGQRHVPGSGLRWQKEGLNTDTAYRTSFGPVESVLILDPWRKPTTAMPLPALLGLDAGQIGVHHSTTGSAAQSALPTKLAMDSRGTVRIELPLTTPPNSTRWKVSFKPNTGIFTGSFELVDGSAKRPVSFTGILRQPHDNTDTLIGDGHFILPALPGVPTHERLSGELLLQR